MQLKRISIVLFILRSTAKMMADPKDNPLGLSWHDSALIPMLNPSNIMDYFSQRSNPFFDRTCNNEIVNMQRLSPEQLTNMTGLEYILLHVQEPILYVIRKQHRHSPTQATPLADYHIIAGVVYQAPDLGSVFNSRLLSAVHSMQSAFDETVSFSRYHPSKGYSWDFKEKSLKVNVGKKEGTKEEMSSLFQRQRVDLLLAELTRKYPIKPPPQQTATAPEQNKPPLDEVKTEPRVEVKTEKPDTPLSQGNAVAGGRMKPPPEKKPRLG
ncbi:hypothetical protein B566_EDAN013144 [Ephemera danica]|nr:hypothetical protein B566_EDAN013144 [Ephemera danica]